MDFFEQVYRGRPPWDTGRPQREFVALEASGEISGGVLDVGCGTGENALYLAGRGHAVLGVDLAPTAIALARRKAADWGLAATFLVRDVLDLAGIGRTFATVIDSGLFHTLSDADRPRFVRSLADLLEPGGTYFMLAFSELEPGEYSLPRRIARKEIRRAFAAGWRVDWIRAATFESSILPDGSRAWLLSITRI
jgi:SAM-dependent methyltransferase